MAINGSTFILAKVVIYSQSSLISYILFFFFNNLSLLTQTHNKKEDLSPLSIYIVYTNIQRRDSNPHILIRIPDSKSGVSTNSTTLGCWCKYTSFI